MGTVISNLKAKFGVDTSDFKKGLKDGESAVSDFKGAAGGVLDEFASMFGVNMGSVNDAISTANKSLNFLGQAFKGAAKGGDILTISAKVLKIALVSTGLGAIIVVLGSIIAYFSKTGSGAREFAKILAEIKSVVNNVIERLAIFGKGLWELMTGKFKQGWTDMTSAFKGMGSEIVEDWKAAGKLSDAEHALNEREISLITSLSERKAKISELRELAKEESTDVHEKLDLLKQAQALIKGVYGDEISLEKEHLRLMKDKLAIETSDPTLEQKKEIADQEEKINNLYRGQADELKGLLKQLNQQIIANDKIDKQFKSFANIKMPDLMASTKKSWEALKESMDKLRPDMIRGGAEMSATFAVLGKSVVDVTDSINQAFESTAVAVGEFLGNLLIGKAGASDFAQVMAGAFADLMITIGKLCIAAAIAVGALSQILINPLLWPLALAAGVALIAVGTAIRGALKSSASGGGGGGSVSGAGASSSQPNSFTYDTTKKGAMNPIPQTITLVAKGRDLVGVIDLENDRRKAIT